MIAQSQQEKRVFSLAEPIAVDLGLEIVRVRVTGGRRPTLQIMIDRAGGHLAGVDECVSLSRALSPVLETEDPISGAFNLEVSTPGIDRPLTRIGDFAAWAGFEAKIELAMPLDGRRRFRGAILSEDEEGVHLHLDDDTELVAQVHEMTKASLVLTDELVDEAGARGGLPPQPEDDDFEDFEVEDDIETDTTPEQGAAQ